MPTVQDCSNFLSAAEINQIGNATIWTPFTGHSLAPWVRVWFIGSDFNVSVGNESSPNSQNHAVIKSFQYGASQGGSDGIKMEIVDEQGMSFSNFILNLFPKDKDKADIGTSTTMAFQFGWITSDCSGNSCTILSKPRKCVALTVDVQFTPGGVIKFTINGNNPVSSINEGPNNETTVYDNNGQGMTLKDAIEEMFEKYNVTPMFLSAIKQYDCGSDGCTTYLRNCVSDPTNDPGNYPEWEFFNNEGCDGKLGKWEPNNKDPVAAAMAWLQQKATNNTPPRGFTIGTCNLYGEQPAIIFWESSLPDCQGRAPNQKSIGTFVVNGGECSNVLSFTPQISWGISSGADKPQGGAQGTGFPATVGGTKSVSSGSSEECDTSGAGTAARLQINQNTTDQYGLTDAQTTALASIANTRANMPWQSKTIMADLVIQGNPYLDNPLMLINSLCSIIVINPFNLHPKTTGNCPDWLADPPMNVFLTNKNWTLTGVSHEIKEGSFTTTLKVTLFAPGVEGDKNAKVGGSGASVSSPG